MKMLTRFGGQKYTFLSILGLVLMSFEGILLPLTLKYIIDSLEVASFQQLIVAVVSGIVGFIILGVIGVFYQGSLAKLSRNVAIKAKSLAYQHFVQEKQAQQVIKSSETLSFIQNDLKLLEQNYVMASMQMLQTFLLSSVAIIYVAANNFLLGILFTSFALLPLILPKLTNQTLEATTARWTEGNQGYTKELTETIKGTETILNYGRLAYFIDKLKVKLARSENNFVKLVTLQVKINTGAYALSYICSLIPLLVGGYFVLENRLETSQLIAIFIASDRIANPLTVGVQCLNKLATTKLIREKLLKYEQEEALVQDSVNYRLPQLFPITFKEVSLFHGEEVILEEINLSINHGDKLLIIGPSGSGKTTFLKALQGRVPISQGSLTFANQTFSEEKTLLQALGVIPQESQIFDETIEFNLTLGESFKEELLEETLNKAGLQEIVSEKGLAYPVGEGGSHLSGGQNRRLEIGRALIRQRPILVADEIYGNLDRKTAANIRQLLLSLSQTLIEVSHQVDDLDLTDYTKVLQISNGKLVEL